MLMEKKDEISLVMMINKLQTAEDIVNFRQLPGKEIEEILKDSPEHLVNIIANVLRAFLLKMNVPVPETERLTDKVREKKMGELFENMEKMDIQAERRNTALEKQRADEANVRANEAEKQAAEERNRAEKEKKRADIAEENSIKLLVELCQDLGASMDAAMQSLRDKKDMTMEEAQKKVEIYWKEPTDIPEKKNSPNG